MIVSLSTVTRTAQIVATLYACITFGYTTQYLLSYPVHSRLSLLLNLPFFSSSSTLRRWPFFSETPTRQEDNVNSMASLELWNSDASANQSSGLNRKTDHLFLSKAFSNSMHPTRIIPFFYRAFSDFENDDITITTLITSNRFLVFARLVERYQGPISVTIHVKNNTSDYHALLDSIHDLYTSTPNMARFVDVHLVMDSFDRQFNTWRNIARLFARTDFVMMLDIDFAICTDFRSAVRLNKSVMAKLRAGHSAFVIPAFEYVNFDEGVDQVAFPSDKQGLLSSVNAGRLAMFHASWAFGHNSTDYPKYYAAAPGEVYKVTSYQSAYEPYVVFKKEGPPWCDERFVGYGGNKAACLFEMYLSGISYYVLSDHFIVHQNHLYEEKARKNERKFNKKIYTDFKVETCLRYFKHYHELGILNSTRGHNVQTECTKLRGFPQIAQQIMD